MASFHASVHVAALLRIQGRADGAKLFRRADDFLDQLKMPFWHPGQQMLVNISGTCPETVPYCAGNQVPCLLAFVVAGRIVKTTQFDAFICAVIMLNTLVSLCRN